MKRVKKHALIILLELSIVLITAMSGAAPHARAGGSIQQIAPLPEAASAGQTRRVGAYFFYWYVMPDQMDPQGYFAFHPPGLTRENAYFHLQPYQFLYQGGTYNTAYYSSAYSPGSNEDPQRWWEWQFRDMTEAGLDFAALNSWDGASFFAPPETRIENVAPYLNGALDTLGNPLQIALYDDTVSEVYQWNMDTSGQIPPPECRPPTAAGCERYRMPLDDEANWHYFLDKIDTFYGAVARDKWATLDGRPVDQGGRPLMLMHQGEGLFGGFVVGGTRHAARLMCTIKKHMIEHFSTADPFLLPNGTWGLWDSGDPALQQPTRCSAVGISVPGDPYIIDGWSAYGMSNGAVCSSPAHPGVCLFPYHTDADRTTAYIGPGNDLYTEGPACAYSGPYGGDGLDYRPFYNARWWSLEGEVLAYCADGRCQDRYYYQSWSVVEAAQPAVDLVLIESWNELVEGTAISKLTTYIAPDLMLGSGPPAPAIYFTENPYHESPWSPWFWLFRTRDIIHEWEDQSARAEIIVDEPRHVPGWFQDTGDFGMWFYGDWFHFARDDDALVSISWTPDLPSDGYYDVYAYWPYTHSGTDDAHYFIHHSGGTALVRIDQSRRWDAGGWSWLGRYPFQSGFSPGKGVELTNQVTHPQGKYVLADAVRFVYWDPWSPPPMRPQLFIPVMLQRVSGDRSEPSRPPLADPYPLPESTSPILPLPGPLSGLEPYPGPTMTPRPSPTATPTPSPTPTPPDLIPPQSQVAPLAPFHNQPGFWVTWTATDPGGSGVARIHVQVRDGTGGPWEDWFPYAGLFAYFGRGLDSHTYYFRSRATDWAGNVEAWPAAPDSDAATMVDLSPPSSEVADLPSYSWSSFAVAWSGQDGGSGVATYDVQYCRDNCGGPDSDWNDWLAGTTQTTGLFSEGWDGHTFYFRSRAHDRAGNAEPWPRRPDAFTLIDAMPPTSAVTNLPRYSRSPFLVTWSGQDSASGVAVYDVQLCQVDCTLPDDAVWTDWITGTAGTAVSFEGDGTVYFRCRAHDRAGNLEEYPTRPDAFTSVDMTPPSSHVGGLPPYSGPSFDVSWAGQDSLSGIASYDIQVGVRQHDGRIGFWSDWLTTTTVLSATFRGAQNGQTYSFRSRARDQAGNLEPWPIQADASTTIDALAPSSQVSGLPAYSAAAFTVTWSGRDEASGIAAYDIQYCPGSCGDGAPWEDWLQGVNATSAFFTGGVDGQTYSFRSRARDHAGNLEPWPAQADASTVVDSLPPVSRVGDLPAYSAAAFTVTWSGQDSTSGIASFDVQVRVDGCCGPLDPWTGWMTGTTALSATFSGGRDGQTYSFRSRAHDRAGNTEAWPAQPDAVTTVDTAPPTSEVRPLPLYSQATFTVTWAGQDAGSGIASYDVQACASAQPSPDCWQDWLRGTTASAAPFSGTHGQIYHFRCRANDALGNLEEYPAAADASTQVDSQAPQTWMELPLALGDPRQGLFLLDWGGQDEPAGLASFDLYFRDEAEATWTPWLQEVTATQAPFTAKLGHTYHFCVRGVDQAGNTEAKGCPGTPGSWPIDSEAVASAPPSSRVGQLPPTAPSNPFLVQWSGLPQDVSYDVQVMDLAAGVWNDWLSGTAAWSAWFTGSPGHTYAFRCRATDTHGSLTIEPWPWGYDALTSVSTANDQNLDVPQEDHTAERSPRFRQAALPPTPSSRHWGRLLAR